MDVRNKIKKLRIEKGLSTYKLAGIITNNGLKISQSAISKIENGNKKLDIYTANKIAEALGVTVNDLLGINELEQEITFLKNRENTIISKEMELESNLEMLKNSKYFISLAYEQTKNLREKIEDGKEITTSELESITSYLKTLSTKSNVVIDFIESEKTKDFTAEDEVKFLSNTQPLDIDTRIEYLPENSSIIRRDIIKLLKDLKYDTKDLSRESFDKIVKSIINIIDYEFYNIKKDKPK